MGNRIKGIQIVIHTGIQTLKIYNVKYRGRRLTDVSNENNVDVFLVRGHFFLCLGLLFYTRLYTKQWKYQIKFKYNNELQILIYTKQPEFYLFLKVYEKY